MDNQVPESLRQLIAALDIIFLFIYLATSYVPFIYSSWNYKKGIVIRRDLWISAAILTLSTIRMVGMLFFVVYYIRSGGGSRNGVYRVTLSLRVMLALTISPIDARVTRWAFKAFKAWKLVRRMKVDQETGPQQPSTNTEPMTRIPRCQQVLAPVDPRGECILKRDGSSLHDCLIFMYWTIPFGILLAATVCAGLILSKAQQHNRHWSYAVAIWLLPSACLMINSCFSSSGRPGPANPTLLRPDSWYSWMIGTMLAAAIFLALYAFDCKLRQKGIIDMADFWTQFAGVMFGWGG
ncbi:hypothetical protein CEP52_003202 [Fusarium oligoseptatum]|uniref:Uncharacterized protein n=1 Tax=Fusarium oligoseptatum TaxID=2604345 RepID=A0A428U9H5_9HYPO|nr:hypothetical protein CEP52_003202 [Fusarium oligoseptatum]